MLNGYILLSRTLLDSDVFASQKLLKIWIWCLCKANYKDKSVPLKIGKGVTIVRVKRGSFLFGRNKAEEELFIDGSTIYKSIQKLQELEMIQIDSNNQYSVITICNYNTYQDPESYEVTTKEQPSNNQVTSKEQVSNTTKKDNKDNNIKNIPLSEIKISDVEDNLKPYFTIAVNFQKLFIANLKEKDAPTKHQEKATFKNYVNPIRLMVENKECTIENLREVYKFLDSPKGEFWKTNILSTSKLREKITTLVMASKAKDNKFKEDKL